MLYDLAMRVLLRGATGKLSEVHVEKVVIDVLFVLHFHDGLRGGWRRREERRDLVHEVVDELRGREDLELGFALSVKHAAELFPAQTISRCGERQARLDVRPVGREVGTREEGEGFLAIR